MYPIRIWDDGKVVAVIEEYGMLDWGQEDGQGEADHDEFTQM